MSASRHEERDLPSLWDDVIAGAGLSRERAQLWLAACVPVDASGGKLVVEAPNPFVEQHIRNDFLADLSRSAERAGLEGGVELRAARSGGDEEREREWTRRARDASRPEPGGVGLNPDRTFENFVVGKSNRLAHAASLAVAEMPGKAYNPLFIWGGVGLGKTHLMHAICHYALARTSGLKVMYLNAEKFINEFIQSIANKQTAQFKERYRNVDLLLMDDIQFLGGKGSSQEEFFHTFNTLHEGNKQVVICSDRQPSELRDIEERLTSRFSWGLVTDIQPPDLETRIAILRRKAMLRGHDVPDDVIQFLAQHIPSNIRELEGALNRVIANSELFSEPVTIERATDWLKDVLRMDLKGPMSIEDIKVAVAEELGISLEELTSARRTARLAQARHIAMFLCHEMTTASQQQIASAFNKKDHTIVIHAYRKIGELIKGPEGVEVKALVDSIRRRS